jgi:ABC-type uncharacterized transport system fused permease/ATPase subunit
MEDTFAKADELAKNVKEYVDTRLSLLKLEVAEKSSSIISSIISKIIVGLVFFISILFLSISLAIFIGTFSGQMYLGFLIVSGIYIFIGMLFWILRDKLIRIPIMNTILKQLF